VTLAAVCGILYNSDGGAPAPRKARDPRGARRRDKLVFGLSPPARLRHSERGSHDR